MILIKITRVIDRKYTSITLDLYDVCCEILYVLKSGYQWRIDVKRLSKLEYLLLLFSMLEQDKR